MTNTNQLAQKEKIQPSPRRSAPEFYDLTPETSPDLIYFSSISENTHRFVQDLGREALRIPLRPKLEGMFRVAAPYVLIVPSYGGGEVGGAIPKQVKTFLNDPVNRGFIRGVITAGNTNFGEHYCIAGPIISQKCKVPELYRFELLGTPTDLEKVRNGLTEFWQNQIKHPDHLARIAS